MSCLTIVGIIALLFGIMFTFTPKILQSVNNSFNRLVMQIDNLAYKYRVGIGLSLIIISAFIIFISYYLKVMYCNL